MSALHFGLCPRSPSLLEDEGMGPGKKGWSSDRWWLRTHMQCSGCVLCKCKKEGTEKGQIVDTLHCGLSFRVSFVLREHRSGSGKKWWSSHRWWWGPSMLCFSCVPSHVHAVGVEKGSSMHALHLPLCLICILVCVPGPPPCWKMKAWGQEKKGGPQTGGG